MAMSQPYDPHRSFVVVHREEEKMTVDDKLPNFVSDIVVFLRFRCAPRQRLKRVESIPHPL